MRAIAVTIGVAAVLVVAPAAHGASSPQVRPAVEAQVAKAQVVKAQVVKAQVVKAQVVGLSAPRHQIVGLRHR